ncbi:MAG TPA: MauE/DoxX family redox-associated membrane protein [Geobacteraceae bacterium]
MTAGNASRIGLRLLLGGLFLYAGVPKILDPVGFAGNVAAYRLLPYFYDYVVAAVFPWLEVTCGILLVIGLRVRAAAMLLLLLDLVFIGVISSAIVRGLDIDCGCFRPGGGSASPWMALGRDLLILCLAAVVFWQADDSGMRRHPARWPLLMFRS